MSSLNAGQCIRVGKRTVVVENLLGSGAFGTVYRVKDTRDQVVFALKDVECTENFQIETVVREINALVAAKHNHIVKIMGVDTYKPSRKTHFLILTEFCAGGDLNRRLDNESNHDLNMKWVYQLADAVNFLHSRQPPIVHRDLKADNVFLANPMTEDIKLGDLGLAREFPAAAQTDSIESYYMTSGVGPTHWMAPEFFTAHYNKKADIFSLGVLFYAIFARHYQIFGKKKMYGVFVKIPNISEENDIGLGLAMYLMKQELVPPFAPSFQASNAMKSVIQDMLKFQPSERPPSDEIFERVRAMRSSFRLSRAQVHVRVQQTSFRLHHQHRTTVSRPCFS